MKTKLPLCGTYFGTPVYLNRGDTIFQTSGPYYTSWVSEDHDAAWYIERAATGNQGNLVVIWDGRATQQSLQAMADYMALTELGYQVPAPDWEQKRFLVPEDWDVIAQHPERLGAGLVSMMALTRKHGLAMATIYTDAHPTQLERLKPDFDNFLGCNVGEVFSFRLNLREEEEELAAATAAATDLGQLAHNFLDSVRAAVARRKGDGWPQLMVTGGITMLDYEVLGGIEIPAVEDYAVPHINIASAISRGLYRQFNLPLWGTDLAHEHYSFIPYRSPHKMPLLTTSLYLKYMAGCKLIIVESGNWWQQSDHVEDTPMHDVPKLDFGSIRINDPRLSAPHVAAARQHYPKINYDSPVCVEYRRRISEFYDFLKANGTPEGQPEARIAAIKGNLDFVGPSGYNPNSVIAGQNDQAETDPRWMHHMPERSWSIFTKTFYPRPPVLGPYNNPFLSGTPYGATDIISFATDPDPKFLAANYDLLLFAGWNSATQAQYQALAEYVRLGGTLFIATPHLSTNTTRNFINYDHSELLNGGDFSELCGVKVKGRGEKFYWALFPGEKRPHGTMPRRKYGTCMINYGELELLPGTEVIAVEDEKFKPLLTRHRLGQGSVYFLNIWQYPGALDRDIGPSSTIDGVGFVGEIYRMLALERRGQTYITDDGQLPGSECNHITYSYFPTNGEICLLNIDFDRPHTCHLHHQGSVESITLAPAEFKLIKPSQP